ncbi:MAG TPA: M1 family metallopeptidase [Ignavibacteriaceae bacterium]|nr:M1 family metallopeptidase [Ignavibacteriaceae bacterium]
MKKSFLIYLISLIIAFLGDVSMRSLACNSANGNLLDNMQNDEEEYIHPEQKKLDILHYDLDILADHRNKIIYGTAVLTATGQADSIVLNFFDNMDILRVALNGAETLFSEYGNKIYIQEKIKTGDTVAVSVTYRGTPVMEGHTSFIFGEINTNPLMYTINEPMSASRWFPSNDLPTDKALLDIKITADSGLVSVSNGKLIGVYPKGSKKTYHWQTKYPISTYLISVNISDYAHFTDTYTGLRNEKMELHYFPVKEHQKEAMIDWEDHPAMIRVFAELFGEYPFIDEKYGVTEFLWMNGALEHQTITSIGYKLVTGRKYFNDILVHELAHQWWGNAVGPASWKDIWLNEGFATYSEALYDEALYGKGALFANMNRIYSIHFAGTLYDPPELFGRMVYDKGAWVLHMLRNEIGDLYFFRLLREYYQKYKYKNASTFDFIALAKEVSEMDLDWFFDQWVFKGDNIPVIEWSKSLKKENNRVYLQIKLSQIQDKFPVYRIPVDIVINYEKRRSERVFVLMDEREKSITVELKDELQTISFDPDTRVLASFNEKESE